MLFPKMEEIKAHLSGHYDGKLRLDQLATRLYTGLTPGAYRQQYNILQD